MDNIKKLDTEQSNSNSRKLDRKSVKEILEIINTSDTTVSREVNKAIPEIQNFVEELVKRFLQGGRLIYVGAGTSGRLAVVDASECPPTFGTNPNQIIALMAGNNSAFKKAVEEAEDNKEAGVKEISELNISELDTVFGVAASGRTPYVIGALEEGKRRGALTGALSCSSNAKIFTPSDHKIFVDTGPEVVAGSTRMKAGTAQKLVLNMISTTTMIKIGKVYDNLMIDVQVKNAKLKERAILLLMKVTKISDKKLAEKTLEESNMNVKAACVMILKNTDYNGATKLLNEVGGFLYKIID